MMHFRFALKEKKPGEETFLHAERLQHYFWCLDQLALVQSIARKRQMDNPSIIELRCLLRYYGHDELQAGTCYWHDCFQRAGIADVWDLICKLLPQSLNDKAPHHPDVIATMREGSKGISEDAKAVHAECKLWLEQNPGKTLRDMQPLDAAFSMQQ